MTQLPPAVKKKILVVEDDPMIAENLKILLQIKGYKVFHAADGAEAVEMARREMPDLILLDLMLPKLSGFDVCRIIKSEPKTKDIRVIVETGLGRMGDVEKAFELGALDYVVKPVENERLVQKIEKAFAE